MSVDEKDYIIEYETTVVGIETVFMAQFSIILLSYTYILFD